MEEPIRSRAAHEEQVSPAPDTTTAAAFAPPPRSAATLVLFVAILALVTCGVAGVLLLFTAAPVGYSVLLLLLAVIAGVVAVNVRRGRAGRRVR